MRTAETRLVLDTNTLISRMLVPRGTAGRAVDKALAEGVLLASEETLTELAEVLCRPKFNPHPASVAELYKRHDRRHIAPSGCQADEAHDRDRPAPRHHERWHPCPRERKSPFA